MQKIEIFRAQKETKRFRLNQKIFICYGWNLGGYKANVLRVAHRWRGKDRWVFSNLAVWNGTWKKANPIIGDFGNIKEIEVEDSFADFIFGHRKSV